MTCDQPSQPTGGIEIKRLRVLGQETGPNDDIIHQMQAERRLAKGFRSRVMPLLQFF